MISPVITLAQAAETATSSGGADTVSSGDSLLDRFSRTFEAVTGYLDILNRPEDLIGILNTIPVYLAASMFVLGVLCILNGYRWHRWVIIVCAFMFGFGIGYLMSRTMPQPYVVAAALALMAAVIANPLLRFSVAFFGGLTGAFVGANLWTMFGLPEQSVLAGAAMGFILFGMASFMMFKHVVVLFTSISGSAMAVISGFALLLYIPDTEFNTMIENAITGNHLLIPLLVTVAAVIGLVLQAGQKPAEVVGGGGGDGDGGSNKN